MAAGQGSRRAGRLRRFLISRRDATERGVTLIEIIVTLWILGTVMVTMSSAIFGVVRTSDFTRRRTLAEAELRRYAEAVRAIAYHNCASDTDYLADVTAAGTYAPADSTVSPDYPAGTGHTSFFKKSAEPFYYSIPANFVPEPSDLNNIYDNKCNNDDPTDSGIQKIDLTITVTGTPDVMAQTTILKRDPSHSSDGAP